VVELWGLWGGTDIAKPDVGRLCVQIGSHVPNWGVAMQRQTRQDKQIDRQIEAIYYRRCAGVQIGILDIPRVFRVGREAILAGADPEPAIVNFVQTIRKN